MQIIHVCPRYYPYVGGVEVVVKNIAEHMRKLRHEVKVYSTDPLIMMPKTKIINGVESRVYPAFALKEAYYLPSPSLSIDLAKEKADILHFHSVHSLTTLASFIGNEVSTKTCFAVSPYFHGKGHTKLAELLHVPYKPLIGWVLRNANGIIVNSKTQKELIETTFGSFSKMFIVYDGVNLKEIQGAKPINSLENFKTILHVGRLEKYKNVQITIDALKSLPENYHFYIIGSGPFKLNLIKYVESLGLTGRVHFLGYLPDGTVHQWMKAADVFVHLSSVESFGMTCIESLAAGTPVIANDDSLGLSETIGLYPEHILGYKVGREPPSKLVNLITRAAELKPVCVDVSMFSWDRIANDMIAAYRNMLNS